MNGKSWNLGNSHQPRDAEDVSGAKTLKRDF